MAKTARQVPPGKRPTPGVSSPRPGQHPAARSSSSSPQKLPAIRRGPSAGVPGKPNGYLGKGDPLAMILYGNSGIGKTDWASRFPNPGFLYDPKEPGICDLVRYKRTKPPRFMQQVDDYEELLNTCDMIGQDDKFMCDTLVIDSMTGMEQLLFAHHCEVYFENDWTVNGFASYGKGADNASKVDLPRFITALDAVRARGISVIVLCHSQVKTFQNPDGADYDRYIPSLDKKTWGVMHKWAQCIIFYHNDVKVDTAPGKKATKGKGSDSSRFLYTEWTPAWDAKNRYGLPPAIMGGDPQETYDAFETEYRKCL